MSCKNVILLSQSLFPHLPGVAHMAESRSPQRSTCKSTERVRVKTKKLILYIHTCGFTYMNTKSSIILSKSKLRIVVFRTIDGSPPPLLGALLLVPPSSISPRSLLSPVALSLRKCCFNICRSTEISNNSKSCQQKKKSNNGKFISLYC